MPRTQPDACPYRRPFAPEFDDCPAFLPSHFVPATAGNQPLPASWTCQRLVATPNPAGGFYGRCSLGTAADRLGWADDVNDRDVAALRALTGALVATVGPALDELWRVKIEAARRATPVGWPPRRLVELAERAMALSQAFIEEHAAEFDAAGLPAADVVEYLRVATRHWVQQRDADRPRLPDDVVSSLPPAVRAFAAATRVESGLIAQKARQRG